MFPALAAVVIPSPGDTPFSARSGLIWAAWVPAGPGSDQHASPLYPHRWEPSLQTLSLSGQTSPGKKQMITRKGRPPLALSVCPARGGRQFQRGNCPHGGPSCAQTPAAASIGPAEKASTLNVCEAPGGPCCSLEPVPCLGLLTGHCAAAPSAFQLSSGPTFPVSPPPPHTCPPIYPAASTPSDVLCNFLVCYVYYLSPAPH